MTVESGTSWKSTEAQRYEVAKHGPDGKIFLDPFLYKMLTTQEVDEKKVLDIGAGTGPWSEYLKKQGAGLVVAVDFNMQMLRTGQAQGRGEHVLFEQATAAKLPHPDNTFDMSLSINVGCNLPNEAFNAHFQEAYRVTKPEGALVVTAPNSLTTVFTDGIDPNTIQFSIDQKWEEADAHSIATAKEILQEFKGVLRGTFILDSTGKPILVTKTNESLVQAGTPILRKIPGLVVDNIYHTSNDYKEAAQAAGWHIVEEYEQSFASKEELDTYNANHTLEEQLGTEYIGNPPFLVLKLEKKG